MDSLKRLSGPFRCGGITHWKTLINVLKFHSKLQLAKLISSEMLLGKRWATNVTLILNDLLLSWNLLQRWVFILTSSISAYSMLKNGFCLKTVPSHPQPLYTITSLSVTPFGPWNGTDNFLCLQQILVDSKISENGKFSLFSKGLRNT